ncbi:MAG: universal stress protein [Solirubrobacteraceae bacterium]
MFETIVWGTDGSGDADRSLPCAEHLAEQFRSSLRVVHIARRPAGGARVVCDDEDEVLAKLRGQAQALRARGLDASLHVIRGAQGSPAKAIADTARSVGADLVIVGTRGRSPAAGALLGSIAQQLLHDSSCPVLAVPPSVAPAGGPVRAHGFHAGLASCG